MVANVGVIVSAGLVVWLDSAIPDLVIGGIIALVIVQSSWKIVAEAKDILTSNPEVASRTIDNPNEGPPLQKEQGAKKQSLSCCGSYTHSNK